MRGLGTIEKEMIVDSLTDRIKSLEKILNDMQSFHMNVNSFYSEIEAHNNLAKLIREG